MSGVLHRKLSSRVLGRFALDGEVDSELEPGGSAPHIPGSRDGEDPDDTDTEDTKVIRWARERMLH